VRPNGRVWLDLFEREWTTDDTLTTDAAGRCDLRAFKGRVRVEATTDGRQAAETVSLDHDAQVTLRLE
jgi:hypothetical protein